MVYPLSGMMFALVYAYIGGELREAYMKYHRETIWEKKIKRTVNEYEEPERIVDEYD